MMKKKRIVLPKFANEAQEADWWASHEGQEFLKQQAAGTGKKEGSASIGSRLVGQLKKDASVQIALRLPAPDCSQGPGTGRPQGHRPRAGLRDKKTRSPSAGGCAIWRATRFTYPL
jgi:hypothetical protein